MTNPVTATTTPDAPPAAETRPERITEWPPADAFDASRGDQARARLLRPRLAGPRPTERGDGHPAHAPGADDRHPRGADHHRAGDRGQAVHVDRPELTATADRRHARDLRPVALAAARTRDRRRRARPRARDRQRPRRAAADRHGHRRSTRDAGGGAAAPPDARLAHARTQPRRPLQGRAHQRRQAAAGHERRLRRRVAFRPRPRRGAQHARRRRPRPTQADRQAGQLPRAAGARERRPAHPPLDRPHPRARRRRRAAAGHDHRGVRARPRPPARPRAGADHDRRAARRQRRAPTARRVRAGLERSCSRQSINTSTI